VSGTNGRRYSILDPERNLTPTLLIIPLRAFGSLYALAARATPSRQALRARGLVRSRATAARDTLPRRRAISRYALAARAMPSRLALCPRDSRYALAARAKKGATYRSIPVVTASDPSGFTKRATHRQEDGSVVGRGFRRQ